jgi:hypothetical protein
VPGAAEAQFQAVVDEPLPVEPLPGAALAEHVRGALLQHPGPLPPLTTAARALSRDVAAHWRGHPETFSAERKTGA